jgi:diaminohydroxyphosphoribosylaminopyrimidine deaminase / 5-amino-6-(5-phosphoribosylamino)uracil reductase
VLVKGPVATVAASAINSRYISNISKKPFVIIKMAMSADGKTATRNGDSKWISCPESRALVHKMRSRSDAVMVGANTIRSDDPELTAHGMGHNPYRVIVDGSLSIPLSARVVMNPDGKTIIATTTMASKTKIRKLSQKGARVFICGEKRVDLGKLALGLSAMGMKIIMIEGGSELNAAAFSAGIVGMLYLFIAPKIIGGRDAKPVIGGIGISAMDEAIKLENMKMKRIGRDFMLEAKVIQR